MKKTKQTKWADPSKSLPSGLVLGKLNTITKGKLATPKSFTVTATTTDYQKQANDFAAKHGIKMAILATDYGKHFSDDRDDRYIFKVKLTRNGKSYTFKFGQSIQAGSKEPTFYDIFTCLQKSDVGSFEDFCGDFGYDSDSRKAERIYDAVGREFKGVERLFGDILEKMQEIQ